MTSDPEVPGRKVLLRPVRKAHKIRRLRTDSPEALDALELTKVLEVGASVLLPEGLSEAERCARLLRACQLYEELEPQSTMEGMLAAQMVNTHLAAMEAMRRAAQPRATPEERDMNLKQSTRLMSLYQQQLVALDRHRGRMQPQVAVEHVHVNAGGQAIVGHVDARRGLASDSGTTEQPFPDLNLKSSEGMPGGSTH